MKHGFIIILLILHWRRSVRWRALSRWQTDCPDDLSLQVVYKNNDVRLELSRLAKQGDPKMKVRCSPPPFFGSPSQQGPRGATRRRSSLISWGQGWSVGLAPSNNVSVSIHETRYKPRLTEWKKNPTFTFRAFRRRFHPKQLTIRTSVRRRRNNNISLSVQ